MVYLAALDNGINPDIVTLKKDGGGIFLEFCTKIFKATFLRYVNEVLFEMVKILKGYIYRRNKSHSTAK